MLEATLYKRIESLKLSASTLQMLTSNYDRMLETEVDENSERR